MSDNLKSKPVKPDVMKSNLKVAPEVTARFVQFVRKYVSDNQEEAAKMIGCSQSTISNIYIGRRPPSANIWNSLITKFNLNQEWLVSGHGSPVLKSTEKKSTLINDLSAMRTEITKLERQMLIYESNQNHLFKVIERMEKRLEAANI